MMNPKLGGLFPILFYNCNDIGYEIKKEGL